MTGWLPEGVGHRVRLLFAVFAVLLAPMPALGLATVDAPLWPNTAVVVLAAVAMGLWAWQLYARDGLPAWTDPVPLAAVVVAAWASGTVAWVVGLLFVLLYGRVLYGRGPRVWLNVVGYHLSHAAAVGVTRGPEEMFALTMLTMAFAILVSAVVMLLVGEVIRAHERLTRREEVLAAAASGLQRAVGHDQVYDAAGTAAMELCHGTPDAAVTLWRADAQAVRMGHALGQVADDQVVDVPMEAIPADLRHQLRVGDPFELGEAASALVQEAVGMDATYSSILIAPFVHGGHFRGALAVASRQSLPTDLVSTLGRLGADVGLALSRADSTMLLRRTVENSSDAILLLARDGAVDFASSAAGELFGRCPDVLVGDRVGDLLAADGRDLGEVLDSVAASPRGPGEVVTARHADGRDRPVEIAVTRLAGTGPGGWVVNLRDVAARLQVEEALRTSERRFRSLAENVSEGMYRMVLRPEPRFEYVNPAMEVMCGFPEQAFLDDPDLTLRQVHPDDREVIERTRERPDQIEWPIEVRWRRPDGEWVWAAFRETIIRDAQGRVAGAMGIVSDVTARKRQERALAAALDKERELTEQLRRVDAMRTTFIQAVSHELRTPLTAITGYTQTLHRSRDLLDPETRDKLLERLEVNADRLDRMLGDLLDVDRLSSHVIEPDRRRVDVVDLVRRVVAQVAPTSHDVSCPDDVVIGCVDAPKVERIIENLIRNAIKHTPTGGRIDVEVGIHDRRDGVVIRVTDDGQGIPEGLQDTVFEPFVQGAASANSATPGMGIGLSLVARFAEMHGGHARVDNVPGGGASFEVWLPDTDGRTTDAEIVEAEAVEVAAGP